MKRKISIAKSFKKDIAKQVIHLATAEWAEVLNCLVQKKELPEKFAEISVDRADWFGLVLVF